MIFHTILVEIIHLFLNGPIQTRITRMQTDNQFSFIIKGFHQRKLFIQIHVGRTTDYRTRFCIISQLFGHQASGIKNQISPLEEMFSPYRNQLRITRSGTHDFNMSFLSRHTTVQSYRPSKLHIPFMINLFRQDQ